MRSPWLWGQILPVAVTFYNAISPDIPLWPTQMQNLLLKNVGHALVNVQERG